MPNINYKKHCKNSSLNFFLKRMVFVVTFVNIFLLVPVLYAAEESSLNEERTSVFEVKTEGAVKKEPDRVESEGAKKAYPMQYHGNASMLNFYLPTLHFSAAKRAQIATELLESHIDNFDEHQEKESSHFKNGDSLNITIEEKGGKYHLSIGHTLLGILNTEDLKEMKVDFKDYQNSMQKSLQTFVDSQYQRHQLQSFFLHLFLSVFILVLLLLSLRAIRDVFDRLEDRLEESKGKIQSFSILKIPVVSREALEAASAFVLSLGRYIVYMIVVFVAFGTILSQFQSTRPLLKRLIVGGSEPIVRGLEHLLSSIPGWILAVLLLFLAKAALRVIDLLFDSMQSGGLSWSLLPPKRIPLIRKWFSFLFVLLLSPFFFAAAFGHFGNTFEKVTLLLLAVLFLSGLPLFTTWVIGAVVIWNEELRAGEWIQIGETIGEITALDVKHLVVVPAEGGSVTIPYFLLLLKPIHRLRNSPELSYEFSVLRDLSARETLDLLSLALKEQHEDLKLELISLDQTVFSFKMSAPSHRHHMRQQMLISLSEICDAHNLCLSQKGF